jgi:hypothetical protein
VLAVVSVGMLLAMSPWLSAAAVAPALRSEWNLSRAEAPLLTVAVQLGFALGALLLAATAAADVLRPPVVFLGGALLAASANLGFALLADGLASALVSSSWLVGSAPAGDWPPGS